jgi:hypothetical protein
MICTYFSCAINKFYHFLSKREKKTRTFFDKRNTFKMLNIGPKSLSSSIQRMKSSEVPNGRNIAATVNEGKTRNEAKSFQALKRSLSTAF